ncbi:32 kDa beta-galactoside-binding lectin lec-3 [Geodia barretti]|uniref:Galectin n=1 Tax=Geodia barretti TaxID=519541 RepID=A0AA35RIA4_GEOBA|nr:32 kDa beta-galactoside-binding lectin lec-3 [Geodia barretti]
MHPFRVSSLLTSHPNHGTWFFFIIIGIQEMEYKDHYAMEDRYAAFFQGLFDPVITVPSLKIGQTIEVVFKNPPTGYLSFNLVTAASDVALHFNPHYTDDGGYVVLNSLIHGAWQEEEKPTGYPFPADNVQTMVTVHITVGQSKFTISVNGIEFATFNYRPGLSYETVRHMTWNAPSEAILESIKIKF